MKKLASASGNSWNHKMKLLLTWLLVALPGLAQAQFTYTTNDDNTLTITGYSGSDGTVVIPSSINSLVVVSIANGAFDYAFNVTNIMIPETLDSFGEHTFSSCISLTAITVNSNNAFFSSVDGVLFNKDQTLLIEFPESKAGGYTIPNTVIKIGDNAFYGKYIFNSVIIPYGVTSIGTNAFANTLLTDIVIPNSVTNIGSGALSECIWLTNVTVGSNVISIEDTAFLDCRSLTNIEIPNSVLNIGSAAFEDCSSLINIVIPNGVTNIGNAVFFGCTSLKNATIPDSISNFGNFAFYYCFNLTNFTIPSHATNIGDSAFLDCANLTGITIPSNVTYIGNNAFYGCSGLSSIIIPNSVTTIEGGAFSGCFGLSNITIPNSVTSIGGGVFLDCISLTHITISDRLSSVEDYTFSGCSSLASITIPKGITNVGDYAFYNCTDLIGVYFQGNVPSLSGVSGVPFYENTNLTVYYLPNATGWEAIFAGRPTAPWLPQEQTPEIKSDNQANQFGFNINWASGQTVVVEASTNLSNPDWQPVQTNTLTTGMAYFNDPQWTNYPNRFYRLRSP